jgi:hypothetical protein
MRRITLGRRLARGVLLTRGIMLRVRDSVFSLVLVGEGKWEVIWGMEGG